MHIKAFERQPREHRDPVIALLPVDRSVDIAEPAQSLLRKAVIRAFGLLQAQDVRTHRLDELRHQVDAQEHRVDVPGGGGETHAGRKIVSSEIVSSSHTYFLLTTHDLTTHS